MVSERQAFGEGLKRHRERRGITLAAISDASKIAKPLFAGLERGDCSRWPAGIYGRAYIRAYAEFVGLNPEEIVEEFASLFCGGPSPEGATRLAGRGRRGGGVLRLSMVEEPRVAPQRARQLGLAGIDLLMASAVAWTTHALLDPGVAITVASGLAYYAAGRAVTDEPVAAWLYRRIRAASEPPAQVSAVEQDVPVGDAASTAA